MANDYSVVLSAKLNEAQAQAELLKALRKIEKNANAKLNIGIKNDTLASNIEKAQLRVDNLRTKYSAFVRDPKLSQAWQALFDQSQIIKSQKELSNLNAKIGVFEQQLEKAGKRARSFGAELKNNVLKMGNWMLLGAVLSGIMRAIGQIYTNVVTVNTAMTELKKVTNETATAYNEFLDSAADKAQNLSAKLSEVVEATSNFARLGFNMEDAAQLAEVAIMYKNVDELQNAVDAYEAVSEAVEEYNDGGFVTDDTLSALEERIPGVISLLYDESGELRDGAAAAFESSDAMLAFLASMIQAQLTAAQADYSNLVAQLGAASLAAVAAQQNIANLQAMLAQITGVQAAGAKKPKGGGGTSSIYSKEYQSAKDYTEHMIKLSELRQQRMDSESAAYKTESQTQIAYYQQLMNNTEAELARLRKKGYDASNKEFRQLTEDYESYQNEIYDIAYNAWKQQQQCCFCGWVWDDGCNCWRCCCGPICK